MMNPRPAGGDPAESLNDWSPVSSPLRRLESPSSLALVLCLASVAGMVIIGTLTSSWVAALASALGYRSLAALRQARRSVHHPLNARLLLEQLLLSYSQAIRTAEHPSP